MAQLIGAIGSSHGPTIQSPVESWARLADGDTRDPRFNYQRLLAAAKPGVEKELTIEVQRTRHTAARAALETLTRYFQDAKPDVVLTISNAHRIRSAEPHPVFGILRAEAFPLQRQSSKRYDPDARFLPDEKRAAADDTIAASGCAALANYLIEALIEDSFDIASIDRLPDGAVLDDAFSFAYDWLFGGELVPMVPFLLSRDLPNQARPARCYELGRALRRQIERCPLDLRVLLLASGGLSHQIVDEEFDHMVVNALVAGDAEAMRALPRQRLNGGPGTPEVLNWVTVAAAMAPRRMTLVDYLPCYRSPAGTGHGLAFGYWT